MADKTREDAAATPSTTTSPTTPATNTTTTTTLGESSADFSERKKKTHKSKKKAEAAAAAAKDNLEEERRRREEEEKAVILRKSNLEAAQAAAHAERARELDENAEFNALDGVKLQESDVFERFPSSLFLAYSKLLGYARELNIQMAVPEIVLVGPRGQGKSALLEAILGRLFNVVFEGATRRPFVINVVNNQTLDIPRCVLKRDMLMKEFNHDMILKPENLAAELQKRNQQVAEEPIVLQWEAKDLLNMTIIDTPGLLLDAHDSNGKIIEQLVLKLIQRPHRSLLVVRGGAEATLTPQNDYVLDLVRRVDPELSRCTFVYTKLNAQLQTMSSTKQVNKFLAGQLPDLRSFFITLPSSKLRGRLGVPEKFMEKLLQASRRDLLQLEQLQFDKRHTRVVGLPLLLKHIFHMIWRSYQEDVPIILKHLRIRKAQTERRLNDCKTQMDGLAAPHLRRIASDYVMKFLQVVEKLLVGTAEGNPAANGQTLEEEKAQCGADAQWMDINGVPLIVEPEEWHISYWQNRLYGGQQLERLLSEFRAVSEHIDISDVSRDDIATAAGIPKLHNLPNYHWAAADLARQKSQDAFEPLIEQVLGERASYIMQRLADVSDKVLESRKKTRGHVSNIEGCSNLTIDECPYFVHHVRDLYFKFVDKMAKICREKCNDEFLSTRTIYWDLTENRSLSLEGDDQVIELTKSLFNTIKERLTRNVLLKFYNFFLVPMQVELWNEIQSKVTSLSDQALEDLFEIGSVRTKMVGEGEELQNTLRNCDEQEKRFVEASTAFSHPVFD